jgi:hypothetical protein
MDRYRVFERGGITVIEGVEQGFKMRVFNAETAKHTVGTAILEATLYIEQRSFIPKCSYIFELVNDAFEPTNKDIELSHFKAAVDFFFYSVIGTDLFVKSVPQTSAMRPQELRYYNDYKLAV